MTRPTKSDAGRTAQSFGSITPIFRSPFLERIARDAHISTLLELGEYYSSYHPPSRTDLLKDWFEFFYALLFKRYRCEYVYKNAIARKLFLSRHSLKESYMTDELRSGVSRADLAILNGTSTVYEIKSQYDSLDRLAGQLTDYGRIFDFIYVVTTETKAASLESKTWPGIGLMVLREDGSLSVLRKAQSNKDNTDPGAIFDCMRQAEYCRALVEGLGLLPSVPNSELYLAARELFCALPPSTAHDLMVRNVRMRGKKKPFADLIAAAPESLKHACLTFTRSQAMATTIFRKLGEPLTT